MNWLKRLFGFLRGYFRTGQAARDTQKALEYVGKALPFVIIAADIITTLTPTFVDDALWRAIKAAYPRLLDGTEKSPEELKAEALVISAELLKAKYPELSTSVARAAAQLAYIDWKAAKGDQ